MAVSRLTQTTLQNGFEKYNQLWDGRSAVGSMEAISSVTLSAAQSSVEFNNIPGTYTHLQLRFIYRSTYNGGNASIYIRYNGDTGNNYWKYHQIFGDGSSAVSNNEGVTSFSSIGYGLGATATANVYSVAITDILDYTSTNKHKVHKSFNGFDVNGAGGYIIFRSGMWFPSSISAINSITLIPEFGSFTQYSSFTLYGIK